MGRKFTKSEQQLKPDPKYGDKVLARFINCVMLDGKRSVAQRIMYDAFDEIEKRNGGEMTGIEVFHLALENVKPNVEVRSKRVGGANYQVPRQVNKKRQQSLAFRWIINVARSEKGKPMFMCIAKELHDAARNEGKAVNQRDQTHRMAEANKAFAHFAF